MSILAKIPTDCIKNEENFSDAAIRALAYLASSRQSEKFRISFATFKAVYGWGRYKARKAINLLIKNGVLTRIPTYDSKGRFYFQYQLAKENLGGEFVRLDAKVVRNDELSDAAFRAYAFMVSVAGAAYQLSAETFKAVFNWGRERHRQAIACLKGNGLLKITQTHGKGGEFAYEYKLSTIAGTTIAGSTIAGLLTPLKLDQSKSDQIKIDQDQDCVYAHDFSEIDPEGDSQEASKDFSHTESQKKVIPQSEDSHEDKSSAGGVVEILAQIEALGIIADAGLKSLVSKCKKGAGSAIAATRQAIDNGWAYNPIGFLKAALKDGYKPLKESMMKESKVEILQDEDGELYRLLKSAKPGARPVTYCKALGIGEPGARDYQKIRAENEAMAGGGHWPDGDWLDRKTGKLWDSFLEYRTDVVLQQQWGANNFAGNRFEVKSYLKKRYRKDADALSDDWEAYVGYWAAKMGTVAFWMDQSAQLPSDKERERLAAHAPAFQSQDFEIQKHFLAKALQLSPERTLLLTEEEAANLVSKLTVSLKKAMEHIKTVNLDAALAAAPIIDKFLGAGEDESVAGLLPPTPKTAEQLQEELRIEAQRRDDAIVRVNELLIYGCIKDAVELVAQYPKHWHLSIENDQLVAGEFIVDLPAAGSDTPKPLPNTQIARTYEKAPTLEVMQARYKDPIFKPGVIRDIDQHPYWNFRIVNDQVVELIDSGTENFEVPLKRMAMSFVRNMYRNSPTATEAMLQRHPDWGYKIADGEVVFAGENDELFGF